MKSLDDILRRQEYLQENMKKVDPFDKGISKAIQSAKMSLGMDRDQSHAAIRSALGNFTNNLSNNNAPPAKNGFGRIAQMGNALTQAVGQYDNYENAAVNHNRNLAKDEMARREQEYAKAVALEKMAADRELAEKELGIKQTANDLKAEANLLKKKGKGGKEDIPHYAKPLVEHNIKKLEDLEKKAEGVDVKNQVLNELKDQLIIANEKGLVGPQLHKWLGVQYQKFFNNENTNIAKLTSIEDMLLAIYLGRVREIGGNNPAVREVEFTLKTLPNSKQEFGVAIGIIDRDIQTNNDYLKRYNEFDQELTHTDFLGYKNYKRIYGIDAKTIAKETKEEEEREEELAELAKRTEEENYLVQVSNGKYIAEVPRHLFESTYKHQGWKDMADFPLDKVTEREDLIQSVKKLPSGPPYRKQNIVKRIFNTLGKARQEEDLSKYPDALKKEWERQELDRNIHQKNPRHNPLVDGNMDPPDINSNFPEVYNPIIQGPYFNDKSKEHSSSIDVPMYSDENVLKKLNRLKNKNLTFNPYGDLFVG